MKKTILLIMLFPLMLSALKIDLSVNKYVISTNDQLEVTLKITDSDRIKVVEPTPPSIPLFSFRNMTSGSSSSVVFEGTANPQEQTIYRGFPTIVSYYLYTDEMVRSFNLENEIDSDGYGKSTYEQPSVLNYENVNLNGKQYKRALIKRLAIIPNKEGRLQAPILEGYARLYRFSYSNKTLRSEGGIINVLPLPKNNVPASFGGAVGDFKISYSLSRKELSLGETITFTLKIRAEVISINFLLLNLLLGKDFRYLLQWL
jgi:hypothetical protein